MNKPSVDYWSSGAALEREENKDEWHDEEEGTQVFWSGEADWMNMQLTFYSFIHMRLPWRAKWSTIV